MSLIKCRECGKEISDKTDKCPYCGCSISSNAKRYSQFYNPPDLHNPDETPAEFKYNYQELQRKRKSQRGSVLSIVSLLLSILSCTFSVMAIISVGNMYNSIRREIASLVVPSESDKNEARETEESEEKKAAEKEVEKNEETPDTLPDNNKEYYLGETWTVDGQWSLTINSILQTDQRSEYEEKNPTQVFIVNYTYENLGFEDDDGILDGLYFDLSSGQIVDSVGTMGYSYLGDIDYYPQETPVGANCQAQTCIGVDNESDEIKITVSKYDGNGNNQKATFTLPISEEQISQEDDEKNGVRGIEARKENNTDNIEDFSYELSGDKIVLNSYSGNDETLEIHANYIVDGESYKTDISNFQIEAGDKYVKTLILEEGITEVKTSIFNSCSIQKIFFPKSINNVYDYTLSYLQPSGDNTIKIYYAGTQEEWLNIFTEYKRPNVEDAEPREEMGASLSDEINEIPDTEYDSSLFEYFFSAVPDDLI